MKRKRAFIWAAGVVLLMILLFLVSPMFHVRHIEVSGNFRISSDEIREQLGLGSTTHLLLFSQNQVRQRLMENLYIGDVQFERVFPNRLYVSITERRLTAYFEHMPGSFLFLDDTGRVLEVRTYFTEPLPVLDGLQFTRFQLGEVLEVPDTAAFNVIVQYAQLLNHHGLIDRVSHINVSDSANIRIIIGNKEFNVGGGIHGADEKVRTILQVLAAMPYPELMRGFMDMRELRPQYFFEMLQ